MVKEISTEAQFKDAIAASGLVVFDFFAQWCGPCKLLAPKYDELAAATSTATFFKVDVDEAEDLAAQVDITAMPTFIGFKNGKEVFRVVGGGSQFEEVRKHVNELK